MCISSLLDEPPRKMSIKTTAWGLLVRLVSGYKPSLYSCQKSLPFLPVPNLNETIDKFLLSIEPLYGKDSEEFKKFKTQSEVYEVNYYKVTLGSVSTASFDK